MASQLKYGKKLMSASPTDERDREINGHRSERTRQADIDDEVVAGAVDWYLKEKILCLVRLV